MAEMSIIGMLFVPALIELKDCLHENHIRMTIDFEKPSRVYALTKPTPVPIHAIPIVNGIVRIIVYLRGKC